ncbi:MAG TPA: hypothetical protein P5081_16575 [Phycisphaerae bacterium]|nr:hypothetical protein [Phycisphaerae bacterium]HRW54487.1 hypothetical protein [Phycisphaerae bacterium]
MYTETFAIPPRRVRRISFLAAATLHAVVIALTLNYLLGRFQQAPVVEPLVRSELVDQEIADRLTAEIARQETPAPDANAGVVTTSSEPGESVILSVASRILDYRDAATEGPDPLESVRQNAALLERISSAGEVDRMADRLRQAMGASDIRIREPDADTPAVDWDVAVQSDGRRLEIDDRIEIHETFVDDKGGASTMIHTREPAEASGEFVYTVALIEAGHRDPPSHCTKEEFDHAIERVAPFEVINQFPLLGELHRSAIVPIMQRMSKDEATSASTTQPASSPDEP